uniref:Uncharacterized protein n=1 Tax=Brassica campestris TaxID=3711 RepID=A0A3P6A4M5_BRACM|nr:unnamed protein product [Brassica rapa]
MSSMMETLQIRKQVSLLVSQRPTSSATISLKENKQEAGENGVVHGSFPRS